jgi:hypothetical protein
VKLVFAQREIMMPSRRVDRRVAERYRLPVIPEVQSIREIWTSIWNDVYWSSLEDGGYYETGIQEPAR